MRAHLALCIALTALSVPPVPVFAAPPAHAKAYGLQRGERLPPAYRHRNYVVDDWRLHRLQAPPRGHQWVAIGADYLLVAIATGVIVSVLTSPGAAAAPAPIAAQPPAAGVFYYFCESSKAYYPYVTQCPEGWRVLPTTPPGHVR